ncbi:MAG: hypothetical protein ABR985_06735 [Methanotrichaceae archaeon]|jgi:hypothetical protein
MQLISLLALVLFLQATAASAVTWGDYVSGDLHWGENISLEGYRLVAADFSTDASRPMVLLKLYKAKDLLIQRPLAPGENFTFDDKVMAEVDSITIPDNSEINDESVASVKLELDAAPQILLHLTSDKDSYEPGEEIRLKLAVENQGTEDAEGIRIKITSNPGLLDYSYGISNITAGQTKNLSDGITEKVISWKAPSPPGPQEFTAKAEAVYSDKDGKDHESAGYTVFEVKGLLSLEKNIEATMELEKSYPVFLSLRNMGENPITVDLSDAIPDGFSTTSGLSWKVKVDPGKTEIVNYTIKAVKTGDGQVLPVATADCELGGKLYETSSESPSVDVIGPNLAVEKQISSSTVNPGEEVEVSVDVINKGNQTIKVSLNESIPDWAHLVRGQTSTSRLLVAGDNIAFSYTISCNTPGDYVIPETVVSCTNAEGHTYRLSSSSLHLLVRDDRPMTKTTNITLIPQNFTGHSNEPANSSTPSANVKSPNESSYIWVLSAAFLAIVYVLLGRIL